MELLCCPMLNTMIHEAKNGDVAAMNAMADFLQESEPAKVRFRKRRNVDAFCPMWIYKLLNERIGTHLSPDRRGDQLFKEHCRKLGYKATWWFSPHPIRLEAGGVDGWGAILLSLREDWLSVAASVASSLNLGLYLGCDNIPDLGYPRYIVAILNTPTVGLVAYRSK